MLIDKRCPNCGATMQFEDTMESMFCPFCGGMVTNESFGYNVAPSYQNTPVLNEPNLYISFNSTDPSVGMVTRIVSTGVKNTYINGQTLSFHLAQGPQTIVLKIGSRNYNRSIVIPSDNSPVRIYASFNGRAHIAIDQPQPNVVNNNSVSGNYSVTPTNNTVNNAPASQQGESKKPIIFGIIGLVILMSMMRSCLCGGSSSSYYEDEETTRAATTATTTIQTIDSEPFSDIETSSRQQRNGFESSTNVELKLANYVCEIPSYWYDIESQGTDNQNKTYVVPNEADNSVVSLFYFVNDDPNNNDIKELLKNQEVYAKSLAEGLGASNYTLIKQEIARLGDVNGLLTVMDATFVVDGVDLEARLYTFMFASTEQQKYIVIGLIESDNANYEYAADLEKTLNSIKKVDD